MIGFAPSGTDVAPVRRNPFPLKSRYWMNGAGNVYEDVGQIPLLAEQLSVTFVAFSGASLSEFLVL